MAAPHRSRQLVALAGPPMQPAPPALLHCLAALLIGPPRPPAPPALLPRKALLAGLPAQPACLHLLQELSLAHLAGASPSAIAAVEAPVPGDCLAQQLAQLLGQRLGEPLAFLVLAFLQLPADPFQACRVPAPEGPAPESECLALERLGAQLPRRGFRLRAPAPGWGLGPGGPHQGVSRSSQQSLLRPAQAQVLPAQALPGGRSSCGPALSRSGRSRPGSRPAPCWHHRQDLGRRSWRR